MTKYADVLITSLSDQRGNVVENTEKMRMMISDDTGLFIRLDQVCFETRGKVFSLAMK